MFFTSIRLGYEGSLDGEINIMRLINELGAAGARFQGCMTRIDEGDHRPSVYIDVETDWYENNGGRKLVDRVVADHVPIPIPVPVDEETIAERLEEPLAAVMLAVAELAEIVYAEV